MDVAQLSYFTELEDTAKKNAAIKRRERRRWTPWYLVLAIGSLALAAIAGFGGLIDLLGKTAAGSVALASAVAIAFNIGIGLKAKDQANAAAQNEGRWEMIAIDARTVRAQGLLRQDNEESRAWLLEEIRRLGDLAKATAVQSPTKLLTPPPQTPTGEVTPAGDDAEDMQHTDKPTTHARLADRVHQILVELGAHEISKQAGSLSIGTGVEAILLWDGERLAVADIGRARKSPQEASEYEYSREDLDDFYGRIVELTGRVPGLSWLLLLFDQSTTIAEQKAMVSWKTRDIELDESRPRIREVVDADYRSLKQQLKSALGIDHE
jgi:hypothetical protein